MKKTNKILLIFVVLIVLALVITYYITRQLPAFPQQPNVISTSTPLHTFSAPDYGFSFSYPDTYDLAERTIDATNTAEKYSVVLSTKTSTPPPVDSEGPPTVSVDVYENTSTLSLANWLTKNPQSNYRLATDKNASDTIAGNIPAVSYNWSGLYEGRSVAFEYTGNVIIFSGTYLAPTDQIKKDFEDIIDSVTVK